MVMTASAVASIALLDGGPFRAWMDWIAGQPAWVLTVTASLLVFMVYFAIQARHLPSHLRAKNRSTLDPHQLEQIMIGAPPQIVDLRSREAYAGEEGHIRGALNIPFDEFRQRIEELDTSHPRPIVLVDEDDRSSHEAMTLLEKRGHRWIYVLKGGYKSWKRAQYPVYFTQGEPKKQ